MTKDEYVEICKKYSDYLNMTDSGDCYIKGAITWCLYQVTAITYEDGIIDSNKVSSQIWYKCCYSSVQKTIQTEPIFCYYANTKEEFEKKIQEFIKNYKKIKVKLKKYEIEQDF